MRKWKLGVLGAARITPKAIVAPASVIPRVHIAGIAARDKTRATTFAKKHGIESVYSDYAELVAAPEIDLIYNPLPITGHAEWSIRALEAGKHVLCEKPFAMNSAEAESMLLAAKKSGKRIIEAFHYRYHPAFAQCLQWVRDGEIGQVHHIDAHFYGFIRFDPNEIRYRKDTGGGAMMDLGCYPLHWVLGLIDQEPEDIQAEAVLSSTGVDESLNASLRFADGVTARLQCTMAFEHRSDAAMRIEGSRGQIEFVNPLASHDGARLVLKNDAGEQSAHISPISSFTWQLAAVVDALSHGGPLPTEGDSVLRQQRNLDAIYRAAGLGELRAPP